MFRLFRFIPKDVHFSLYSNLLHKETRTPAVVHVSAQHAHRHTESHTHNGCQKEMFGFPLSKLPSKAAESKCLITHAKENPLR